MKKLLYFSVFFIFILIFLFLNLGRFLDVTEPPSKTDLLVCLGGNKNRIIKVLELYKGKYLNTDKIILTGYENPKSYNINSNEIIDLRLKKINNKEYENIDFVYNNTLKSTAEEIFFVKKYMKENNLKKVIFVTEFPHSRRVKLLFNILDANINLEASIVSNDYKIWNADQYYKNKYTLSYSLIEAIKILHNIVFYKIFYNSIFFKDIKEFIDKNKHKLTNSLKNSF